MSRVFRVSSALRTPDASATPGRPCTQSPTEIRWSPGLFGLVYVPLLPGGVRLSIREGTLSAPDQVSQPKLPDWLPLNTSGRVDPGCTPWTVAAERAIG